jgi:stringent starvation protein B
MSDNGHTPHIVVDATDERTVVPTDFVEDGRIVLNVSYAATQGLVLGNDAVTFRARFGGNPFEVSVPASAVLAIYARETGEGMVFGENLREGGSDGAGEESSGAEKPDRSHLRVIK